MKKAAESQEMARRILEVSGSLVLIIAASPLFVLTAIAIWLTDLGPVFFMQTRAGVHGKPFQLLKFRSMRVNNRPLDWSEEIGQRDPLVTRVGRVIRRLKIDELPQLVNVIRGDMSWVGPRPTIMAQVEIYTAFQKRRLEVLPGLTGWAQVNGGAEISWDDRIILEVWYVEHRSLWLDLKILLKTVSVILFGHKANPEALAEALQFARREVGMMNQEVCGLDCGALTARSARQN